MTWNKPFRITLASTTRVGWWTQQGQIEDPKPTGPKRANICKLIGTIRVTWLSGGIHVYSYEACSGLLPPRFSSILDLDADHLEAMVDFGVVPTRPVAPTFVAYSAMLNAQL